MKKLVVYIPRNINNTSSNQKSLKFILKNKNKYEFICNINNDELNYPIIDEREPIFFNYTSIKLIKLLRMSENITEFNKLLKSCSLYIQLIRCYFIVNYSTSNSSSSKYSVKKYYKSLSLSKKTNSNMFNNRKHKSI